MSTKKELRENILINQSKREVPRFTEFLPKSLLEYLGRYTHKVAISTHRIREITD